MKGLRQEPVQQAVTAEDLHQQIMRRAFELYEQRGKVHGFDLDDWLQAEAEILDARDMLNARREWTRRGRPSWQVFYYIRAV